MRGGGREEKRINQGPVIGSPKKIVYKKNRAGARREIRRILNPALLGNNRNVVQKSFRQKMPKTLKNTQIHQKELLLFSCFP